MMREHSFAKGVVKYLLGAATAIACLAWSWNALADSTPMPSAAAPVNAGALARLKTSAGKTEFVQTYCTGCHNAKLKTGGLVLEGAATDDLSAHPEIWEAVAKKLAAGTMPPRAVQKRPDPAAAHAMVMSLIGELDAAERKHPFAGRTVVRRLNRSEYGNAVHDLLDIDFPYAGDLPQDGAANGFDNMADSLSISPVLLESYLKVARKVSDLALGQGDASPIIERYPATKSQAVWQGAGMPFGARGGILVKKYFPRDGDYDLRAFLAPSDLSPVEGVRFFHTRVSVKAGSHTFIVTFPQSDAAHEGPVPDLAGPGGAQAGPLDVSGSALRPDLWFLLDGKLVKTFQVAGPTAGEAALGANSGAPSLSRAEVGGPYNAGAPADTASRRRVMICMPKNAAQERPCATKILAMVLRRAWRRNVAQAEVNLFLTAYDQGRKQGDFSAAVAMALRDILVSPNFLFRVEFDPQNARPAQTYPVNDFDLASRLSFFLWDSIPDDRLLDVAAHGQLHRSALLDREVRRMLADPRADSLTDNFAVQWLGLRNGNHPLEGFAPDQRTYPDYDQALGDAFMTEVQLFLRSIRTEDRGILDVIDANYTFLNGRLAANYGIPDVKGPGFRRVTLPADSPRGGILGMGAVLMPNSHTTSTSPVYRGEWILTNILNAPPAPPPNGVPPLNTGPLNGKVLTVREQMERHRASPVCASCHAGMDPYGFSLENFDVLGRWRDADAGGKIDATATLPSGQVLSGPAGLRKALADNGEVFVQATVARMMSYALGREVEARDMPEVRRIVSKAKPDGYKFNDLVLGIVHSTPFLDKQVEGAML